MRKQRFFVFWQIAQLGHFLCWFFWHWATNCVIYETIKNRELWSTLAIKKRRLKYQDGGRSGLDKEWRRWCFIHSYCLAADQVSLGHKEKKTCWSIIPRFPVIAKCLLKIFLVARRARELKNDLKFNTLCSVDQIGSLPLCFSWDICDLSLVTLIPSFPEMSPWQLGQSCHINI